MRPKPCGFTLIELLVVIGIIALLLGLLLPALSRARAKARQVKCLSSLRQMMIAANIYANENGGRFPLAYWASADIAMTWDFTRIRDAAGQWQIVPGLLWTGTNTGMEIQQCPEFDGKSNSPGDPFTGYNYNTSYIGGGQFELHVEPAKTSWISDPTGTAVFGDGEYSAGANKFMRAPRHGGRDGATSARPAGTQGYRHLGETSVAFADGHAASWRPRFTLFDIGPVARPIERDLKSERFGYLSLDNSAYDLEEPDENPMAVVGER